MARAWWLGAVGLGLVACGSEGSPAATAGGAGDGGGPAAAGGAGSPTAGTASGGSAGVSGGSLQGGATSGGQAGQGAAGSAECGGKGCFLDCVCEGQAHDACVASCSAGPSSVQRVVLKSASFTVPAGGEVYECQNFKNPFGQDVEVQATESFMSPGSHHLFAFYGPNEDGPLEECSGLEFTRSIHTAQSSYNLFNYPPGVAVRVKSTEGVRFNAHYFNPTDHAIEASITVAFYLADPASITQHAGHFFYNNLGVYVPAHSPGKAKTTCTVPRDVSLFTVTSHMHQFGKLFTASLDDGTQLYETTSWSDAEFKTFDPPILLKKGQKITYECQYENPTDKPLTFGESAATNEMCILSGRYFAPGDGAPIECP